MPDFLYLWGLFAPEVFYISIIISAVRKIISKTI